MFRRRLFWIILLVLVLVAAGAGYYYYNNIYLQAQEPVEEETIATYTVGRGDLVITADIGLEVVDNELVATIAG